MLKEGMFPTFLVAYTFFLGVNLKKVFGTFAFVNLLKYS